MEGCLHICVLCHLAIGIASPAYILSVIGMVGADLYLLKILRGLRIENRKECGDFFLKNNRYGMMIFLSLLLTNVLEWAKSILLKPDSDP